MDEYQIEIRDLRRALAQLQERDAAPDLIAEYEAEVRMHTALYTAARDTFSAGSAAMRDALDALGFGDWTLDNVYSFVYELAMELPPDGDRDLASRINETDFAGSLLEAMEPD